MLWDFFIILGKESIDKIMPEQLTDKKNVRKRI